MTSGTARPGKRWEELLASLCSGRELTRLLTAEDDRGFEEKAAREALEMIEAEIRMELRARGAS